MIGFNSLLIIFPLVFLCYSASLSELFAKKPEEDNDILLNQAPTEPQDAPRFKVTLSLYIFVQVLTIFSPYSNQFCLP